MSVAAGLRVGPYEVTALIGEGGMGQVWRARDARLDRDVAIKVLPDGFASDPERLARFARESQILAALNHPHIATVHGIEETPFGRALVMELVPGPTLAERLASGPIDLADVLAIARDLAGALESAHERGIVHRDVKPSNLKLAADGGVKVLDFGLAKPEQGMASAITTRAPAEVVTATGPGRVLGTVAYMSPEQARGQPVDRRSDIWGFGCVLYELLARRRAFTGESLTDVLAKVVTVDPDWTALPSTTPQPVRRLVERCLRKDPRQRLRDIGDARLVLEDVIAGHEEAVAPGAVRPAASTGRAAYVAASVSLLAVVAGALAGWYVRGPGAQQPLRKLEVSVQDAIIDVFTRPRIAPDGHGIVYGAGDRLWVRRLDSLEPLELNGSVGGESPFWSRDSRTVVFANKRRLWRVPAAGGDPVAICDLPGSGRIISGTWQDDDTIAFSSWQAPIYVVNARGGDPRVLVPLAPTEVDLHELVSLPRNRGLLFVRHERVGELQHIEAFANGQRTIVLESHGNARFDNPRYTTQGYLVFERLDTNAGIWAAPFSLERLALAGDPVRLAPAATMPGVSNEGTLIYTEQTGTYELTWVNRAGERIGTVGAPQIELQMPAISPDGTRAVASAAEPPNLQDRDLWIHDLATGRRSRLQPVATPTRDVGGTWSPDGRWLYYLQLRRDRDPSMLVAVAPDRAEAVHDVTPANTRVSFSPDGRTAVYGRVSAERRMEIWRASVSGDPPVFQPVLFLRVSGHAHEPRLSPNGRFVAYMSDESGANEVYVRRLSGGDDRWRLSSEGGTHPAWNRAGTELFYRDPHGAIMVVPVETGAELTAGEPRLLFAQERVRVRTSRGWDVGPDGQRFLLVGIADAMRRGQIVVVQNWLAEITR